MVDGGGREDGRRDERRECLSDFGLRQVGHHDGGIEASLGHLMEVDAGLGVALTEVDTLVKEHGRVAMGVEGQDVVMQVLCIAIVLGLVDKPLEEGQRSVETFRMPLYADNALVFSTLDGFDNAVVGTCHDAEAGASL